jgi:hypothetical protein
MLSCFCNYFFILVRVMGNLILKLKMWYCGKRVDFYDNNIRQISGFQVLPSTDVRFHWSAIFVRRLVYFFQKSGNGL